MNAERVAAGAIPSPRDQPGIRTALSDDAIVERLRAGESALFEAVMRRYNQRLYRVARSIVRNDAEAEDVVQDTYVRAYIHLDQYAGTAKFSTWLTRIAVNEGLRRVRARGRANDMRHLATTVPVAADAAERHASQREVRRILESTIDALPPAFRAVVMLRDVEGLSTAETADCLGIPPATVKTRLHRGHALLRHTLGVALGASCAELFAFGSTRCDRVVQATLDRIALPR